MYYALFKPRLKALLGSQKLVLTVIAMNYALIFGVRESP